MRCPKCLKLTNSIKHYEHEGLVRKKYRCPLCLDVFTHLKDIGKHLMGHEKRLRTASADHSFAWTQLLNPEIENTISSPLLVHKCLDNECQGRRDSFISMANLMNHYRVYHQKPNFLYAKESFQCPSCTTSQNYGNVNHLASCDPPKYALVYECKICPKGGSFANQTEFIHHLDTHPLMSKTL